MGVEQQTDRITVSQLSEEAAALIVEITANNQQDGVEGAWKTSSDVLARDLVRMLSREVES